jgi:hypothetical protein
VVSLADHIVRLRLAGKIQRRGFFFNYMPDGGTVIDLTEHRLERIRRQYC